jgi:two-component system sensor kinase
VCRRDLADAGTDLLAARIYSRLAYSYWFSRGAVPCGWAHLREMNLLERYPPTLELAQAYSEHAPVASTLPWFSRGIAYAEKSLEIRRRFGDVWGQGQSLHFYGVVLYAASRFEAAIEKLTEAIRLLDRTGDQWEISTALWHLGFCHYRLGHTAESVAMFRRCMDNGLLTDNLQATAIGLSGLAKVTGGDVDADQVAGLLARCAGDVHTTGELAAGEAVRLLSTGSVEAAVDLLTRVHRDVRRAGVRNEYVAPLLPWLLTAVRYQVEAAGPYDVRRRRRLLRRTTWVALRARFVAEAFRNNLPHVLREEALLALLRGRRRTARRHVRRGVKVAGRLGMTVELSELRRVQHLVEARDTLTASDDAAEPPITTRSSTDGVTLSLVDRFDALLRVGRAIATALTPEAIYDAVRAAAVELLRSESCAIAVVTDDGRPVASLRPLDESSGAMLSEQLVADAVRTRTVAIYVQDRVDPSASIVLQQARSALAAPIFVRGRPVACWHVVHRQVSDLFGVEERRLAEFISALAGAALENAEGFAEVQALSHSLELRVEERTSELSVANTALRSTLAELERVNHELRRLDELKSDFVAMVSHELRSPLTSIMGYCSTMMRHWDRVDDDRKREFIDIIDTQSRRLSGLVNDLLEMSRIESGHIDTHLRPLPAAAVIDEVAREYADRIPKLEVQGDLDVVVVADADHLRRVLINLLDNAIKYGAEPVTIEVTEDTETARVAVRDRGDGVPEDFRPRLFEKFAQASAGSTRKATGTGLGLSIVRGLVDAMAGDVWYEPPTDRAGGGFVVRLPRAD